MTIGICDDENVFRMNTKKMCLNYLQDRKLNSKIIEFTSGEQLLSHKGKINVLILDIEMSGMNGIQVKEALDEEHCDIIIIYLTNHIEFMQEAFGKQVYSFLIKPIDKDKFYKVMDSIIRDWNENFTININDSKKPFIKVNSIFYIKAEDKYSKIITEDNEYLVRRCMNEWEKILNDHDFFRIHKSFIVNFVFVKKIDDVIILENGDEIKLSRNKSKEFKEKYYTYIKRKAKL